MERVRRILLAVAIGTLGLSVAAGIRKEVVWAECFSYSDIPLLRGRIYDAGGSRGGGVGQGLPVADRKTADGIETGYGIGWSLHVWPSGVREVRQLGDTVGGQAEA